jgi:RHS repeat-associated protein
VGIECGNEEVEREQMIADSIFLIYFDERIQNMKPVAHIKPYTTGGRPPVNCCVLHSQLLLKSKIGACLGESGAFDEIPCSVFNPLQRSLIGVPCSVFISPYLAGIEEQLNRHEPETEQFFYHPDHLGSSSFISDADGHGYQHLQYMPFGETFVTQKLASWSTPYQFFAKEKDDETGFNYFGARYYNSDISVWLSVDPIG